MYMVLTSSFLALVLTLVSSSWPCPRPRVPCPWPCSCHWTQSPWVHDNITAYLYRHFEVFVVILFCLNCIKVWSVDSRESN